MIIITRVLSSHVSCSSFIKCDAIASWLSAFYEIRTPNDVNIKQKNVLNHQSTIIIQNSNEKDLSI